MDANNAIPGVLLGLRVDALPLIAEQGESVVIKIFTRLAPAPCTQLSFIVRSLTGELLTKERVGLSTQAGLQYETKIALDGRFSPGTYTVEAAVEDSRSLALTEFRVAFPGFLRTVAAFNEAVELRRKAATLSTIGRAAAIGALTQSAQLYIEADCFDCAALTYRDIALLFFEANDMEGARANAQKALVYMYLADDPCDSQSGGGFGSSWQFDELKPLLHVLPECSHYSSVEVHSLLIAILSSLAETSIHYREALARDVNLARYRFEAYVALCAADQERAIAMLPSVTAHMCSDPQAYRALLAETCKHLGVRCLYVRAADLAREMTQQEAHLFRAVLTEICPPHFASDRPNICYVQIEPGVQAFEEIPSSHFLVASLWEFVGETSYDDVKNAVYNLSDGDN